jgi:hypothetical protein
VPATTLGQIATPNHIFDHWPPTLIELRCIRCSRNSGEPNGEKSPN